MGGKGHPKSRQAIRDHPQRAAVPPHPPKHGRRAGCLSVALRRRARIGGLSLHGAPCRAPQTHGGVATRNQCVHRLRMRKLLARVWCNKCGLGQPCCRDQGQGPEARSRVRAVQVPWEHHHPGLPVAEWAAQWPRAAVRQESSLGSARRIWSSTWRASLAAVVEARPLTIVEERALLGSP